MSIDHYKEAERLLYRSDEQDLDYARLSVAQAQVHATLATVQQSRQLEAADELARTMHTHSGIVVPWPPSDELVEAVESAMKDLLDKLPLQIMPSGIRQLRRAVLDAIHKQVVGDE